MSQEFPSRFRPLIPAAETAASLAGAGEPGPAGLEELSARLHSWSSLWGEHPEGGPASDERHVVRERLVGWLGRCFGPKMPEALQQEGNGISLASSTPIFTAFLGRRATRELSRRVLRDL